MHGNHVKSARTNRRTPGRHNQQKRHLGQCPLSGKVRFRDKREALDALHRAVAIRQLTEANGQSCRRQERRVYACVSCSGWHLTSQAARDQQSNLKPVETVWLIESPVALVVETAAKRAC